MQLLVIMFMELSTSIISSLTSALSLPTLLLCLSASSGYSGIFTLPADVRVSEVPAGEIPNASKHYMDMNMASFLVIKKLLIYSLHPCTFLC